MRNGSRCAETGRCSGPSQANRRIKLMLAALAFAHASAAGAATSIHADTAPGLSLGTTVTNKGTLYTINNGTLVGANLFESFSDFSLAAGNTARWTYTAGNPASIANVINRVTGGAPSTIAGAINATALPNADFYFINPAGIVFGTGASVSVGGAAHFSTSSQLTFSDGAFFTATTASGSTLTMAPPSAFGFLGGEGDISIASVKGGFTKSSSFVAADIQASSSSLTASHLDLIAVGNQALTVPVTDPLSAAGFSGTLTLTATSLTGQAQATAGAAINIGAGPATLAGASQVKSLAAAGQNGGSIAATVASLSMDDSSLVSTTAGAGNAGDVDVSVAGGAQLTDRAFIASTSSASGNTGSVNLTAQSLSLSRSTISATSSGASGQSGTVNIDLMGPFTAVISSSVRSTDVGGDTGPISITAQSLSMDDSNVASGPSAAGAAGAISLKVSGPIMLTDNSYLSSTGQSIVEATLSGPISVTAQSLVLTGSNIEALSRGNVGASAVTLDVAGGLTMNNAQINSGVVDGVTGPITIEAQSLTMNESNILSEPSDSGPGGAISITVTDALTMTGQGSSTSFIHSQSRGSGGVGRGGAITIAAQSILLSDSNLSVNTIGELDAGAINLTASGAVALVNGAQIGAQTNGDGAGGAIDITAQSLDLNSGQLLSSTAGPNNAGSVTINVTGAVDLENLGLIHSVSEAVGDGLAGDVTINAAAVNLQSRAEILTNSSSANAGGNISIGNPDGSTTVSVDGRFTVIESSNVSSSGGLGGDIQIYAAGLVVSNGAQIHTDATDGQAGSITLDFPRGGLLTVEGTSLPGAITTNSTSTEAGRITINNPSAIILDGSDIEAQGPSKGAFVTINSPAVIQSSDHENKFIVTGVVTLDGEYVDVSRSVEISDLSFVDASKVLQGQCAALASSGETSRLTDTLKGPFGRPGERPLKAGAFAWRTPASSTCGPAPGPN